MEGRVIAAWAHLRINISGLYDQPKARFALRIRLLQAEVERAMLYGCAHRGCIHVASETCTLPTTSFSCLNVGFRREDRSGHKTPSYGDMPDMTPQAPTFACKGPCPMGRDTSSEAHRGPSYGVPRKCLKEAGRHPKHWGNRLPAKLRALGATTLEGTTKIVACPRCGGPRLTRLSHSGRREREQVVLGR